MHTYWIILILTLISTPNVPILVNLNIKVCLIIMQITMYDHYANPHLFDHYADQHLFDHCADHHLSDHHANIVQLSKL